jgi:endonuclease YncB( thermonuclease family)
MYRLIGLAIMLSLLVASQVHAVELKGKVTKVIDGDTIWINGKNKLRLVWIDAPELKQAYGIEAKTFLTNLVGEKDIVATCGKADRYGRLVCVITIDNINVNKEMVKTGNAWSYKHYSSTTVDQLQEEAKAKNLGMWETLDPTCIPADFRKKLCK